MPATLDAPADPRVIDFDVQTEEMLVNMGPQHPSTHGVLRLLLRTDGEIVRECTPHIGYLHRCAEKIGENLTPAQFVPYCDRMDYLAAMNMDLGWSCAVEKLLKIDVPERGRHLRVAIAELGRIASHLLGMGAYGLDLGTFSPFLYAFREREMILDLFEQACGARLTYSYLTPGGSTNDLPERIPVPPGLAQVTGTPEGTEMSWCDAARLFLDWFEPRIPEYHTLLTRNGIFIKRTAGIGALSEDLAVGHGCTGPVLRGSGVNHDLRRDGEDIYTRHYDGYDFEVDRRPLRRRPARSRARRQLDAVLRPHAGGRAERPPRPASAGPVRGDGRRVAGAAPLEPETAEATSATWRPSAPAARWASGSSATAHPVPGAGAGEEQQFLQPDGHRPAERGVFHRGRSLDPRQPRRGDGRDRPLTRVFVAEAAAEPQERENPRLPPAAVRCHKAGTFARGRGTWDHSRKFQS